LALLYNVHCFSAEAAFAALEIARSARNISMNLNVIILVILVLFLIGALPRWPHSMNWGYYPSGGIGILIIILIILLVI